MPGLLPVFFLVDRLQRRYFPNIGSCSSTHQIGGLGVILVTGAAGTIGRPLIDVLVNEGAEVRAVIRGPGPASLPEGVQAVGAALSYPETVAPWLEGVTALCLHPRAGGLAAGRLLALARERGCSGWQRCRRQTSTIPGAVSRAGAAGDWRHAGQFLLSRGSEGGA